MTQQPPPKKSGSRDISALKERLRPKTGSNAPVTGRVPAPPGGSVLPPPGLDVPPPPGVATAAPAAPAAPAHDAHDPFGAMNALAQQGAAQRAPEIVIVHDGKPVESVSTGHRAANIAKYAVIAILPFVVGIAIRGISKDAAAYNSGISGAKYILNDVKGLKKSLAGLKDKLDESAKKDLSGREITSALAAFDKLELKDETVYKAKQNSLGAQLSGQVLGFYGAATELKQMIADHVKWAKNDDAALGAALEATKKLVLPKELQLAGKYRYAVMMWNPTPEEARVDTAPPGARVVEIGPPYCGGDDKPTLTGGCPADKPVTTLAVRYTPGGNWVRGDFLALEPGEPVASKKVVQVSSNGVDDLFAVMAMSPQGAAAELAYRKRLQHIVEKLAETVDLGNKLEDKLKTKANEKSHFTFFM